MNKRALCAGIIAYEQALSPVLGVHYSLKHDPGGIVTLMNKVASWVILFYKMKIVWDTLSSSFLKCFVVIGWD